jgi:FKBP-type peptidyl-prolyl cis-trans isomerase
MMVKPSAAATIMFFVAAAKAENGLVSGGGSVTITRAAGPTDECDEVDRVKVGDHLEIHYTGTIDESSKAGTPGQQFDSSRDHVRYVYGDETFSFTIGMGEVIDGWDEGLLGLCKGAHATLVVPPEFGYGDEGAGDAVPGGATLNFEVEVVEVERDAPTTGEFDDAHPPAHGEGEAGMDANAAADFEDPYKVCYTP